MSIRATNSMQGTFSQSNATNGGFVEKKGTIHAENRLQNALRLAELFRIQIESYHSSNSNEFQETEISAFVAERIQNALFKAEQSKNSTDFPTPQKCQTEEIPSQSPADNPLFMLMELPDSGDSFKELDLLMSFPNLDIVNPFAVKKGIRSARKVKVYSPLQSSTKPPLSSGANLNEYKGFSRKFGKNLTNHENEISHASETTFRRESWAKDYYLQDQIPQDDGYSSDTEVLSDDDGCEKSKVFDLQTHFSIEERNSDSSSDDKVLKTGFDDPSRASDLETHFSIDDRELDFSSEDTDLDLQMDLDDTRRASDLETHFNDEDRDLGDYELPTPKPSTRAPHPPQGLRSSRSMIKTRERHIF